MEPDSRKMYFLFIYNNSCESKDYKIKTGSKLEKVL